MIDFAKNAKDKDDEMLRILAANYIITKLISSRDFRGWRGRTWGLNTMIDVVYEKDGLQGLKLTLLETTWNFLL